MQYKYQLDNSSRKFLCPGCGKKRFVRFVDKETGRYCDDVFGRCDREIECSYYKLPGGITNNFIATPEPPKPPFYIPEKDVIKTLSHYDENNLYIFLGRLFGEQKTKSIFLLYCVGTSKHWAGATLFWQKNINGKTGQGKIMLFDPDTGKRIKTPFPHISSVHAQLNKQEQRPGHCFFGEHLIPVFPSKPIAIVESEKTALIMTITEPGYIWLASGGLSNLAAKRMDKYKKRRIVFYPDLGAFNKWELKADELNRAGFKINISSILEEKASITDKTEGFDIADYFVKNMRSSNRQDENLSRLIILNPALQALIDKFQLGPIR